MGRVGLPLAVLLSTETSYQVIGVEPNSERRKSISEYKTPFYEGQLEEYFERLKKTDFQVLEPQAIEANIHIICVGTEVNEEGQFLDGPLKSVIKELKTCLRTGDLLLLRSTVPIGTSESYIVSELDCENKGIYFSHTPERCFQGEVLSGLKSLPQICGSLNKESEVKTEEFYSSFNSQFMALNSIRSAEVIKLVDNAHRDALFALGNEVAMICDSMGVPSTEIINKANDYFKRKPIARPGLVGGSCLTKDPKHLMRSHEASPVSLLGHSRPLNRSVIKHGLDFVESSIQKAKQITILGTAFKGMPLTDDLRGTPAKWLMDEILERNPSIQFKVWDPLEMPEELDFENMKRENTIAEACASSDLVFCQILSDQIRNAGLGEILKGVNSGALVYDFWGHFEDQVSHSQRDQYLSFGSHCFFKDSKS